MSVRGDGIYIKEIPNDIQLTPEERAVLTEHPKGNLSEPVLSFPCEVSALQTFLVQQSIGIDELDVEGFLAESNWSGDEASSPVREQSVVHKLRDRVHALEHIINEAKKNAAEPQNYHAVWAELVRLAERVPCSHPLVGYAEGDIKYYGKGDAVKTFNKDALRKKMSYQSKKK